MTEPELGDTSDEGIDHGGPSPGETVPMEQRVNRVPGLAEVARLRLRELDPHGPIRGLVGESWIDALINHHATSHALDRLPALFLLLAQQDGDVLHSFEADIRSIQAVSEQGAQRVAAFLRDGRGVTLEEERQWVAGCAELALCAALSERLTPDQVKIEPELPNGRRCDVSVQLSDSMWIWIECTVLTTSTSDFHEFDHLAAVQGHAGSPYHDAGRVYRKAFDKIAGTDKMASQLHPDEPSVLVMVEGSAISPGLDCLGADWAIEQMLDPDARSDTSDASLLKFVSREYPGRDTEALAALENLSAMVIGGYRSSPARLYPNDAADSRHRLTFGQRRELAELLSSLDRAWLRLDVEV